MKTWDKATADRWILAMEEHQRLDEYVQGDWFDGVRGCMYGCNMQTKDSPLEKAIKDMNLPSWLVYLTEKIFEGLPFAISLIIPPVRITARSIVPSLSALFIAPVPSGNSIHSKLIP